MRSEATSLIRNMFYSVLPFYVWLLRRPPVWKVCMIFFSSIILFIIPVSIILFILLTISDNFSSGGFIGTLFFNVKMAGLYFLFFEIQPLWQSNFWKNISPQCIIINAQVYLYYYFLILFCSGWRRIITLPWQATDIQEYINIYVTNANDNIYLLNCMLTKGSYSLILQQYISQIYK